MTSCKTRKGTYDIACFHAAKDLPAEWDTLIPEEHFLQRQYLAITESTHLPDVSFEYVLLSLHDKPVAAVYFQLLRIKAQHLNTASLKPWQSTAWKAFTSVAHPKLLIAGHLFRHDVASFYYDASLTDFEAYQLYKQAIDTALSDTCAHAVLVKDTPAQLITYFQNYAPQYLLLRNDIAMTMDILPEWQTVEDYEKALKHKYAQRMRKIRQAWKGVELRELSAVDVAGNKERIYQLYLQVCEKQTARIGYLSADFLPILKKEYGDSLKVWGIYEEGEMIGFFSAWVKEEAFDMFYIGFDYKRNAELQLYFNILFYAVEQAIVLRKPKLILGRTALDAKARLGCKPHYLSTFIFIRNRWVRTAVLSLQNRSLTQEGEWEQRHPFRK